MSYKDIIELLKNTCSLVNDSGKFVNERKPDGTFEFEPPYPIIQVGGIRSTIDRDNSLYTHNIVLFFWKNDSLQNSRQDTEDIMQEMFLLSEAYMDTLHRNNQIRITGETKTPEPRRNAGKITGYGVAFNLLAVKPC
jgi:hypothetical protein